MGETACFYLDDETSWPVEIRDMLTEHFGALKGYEITKRRITQLAEKEVRLRITRPENPFQYLYDDVLADCTALTTNFDVAAFHCTRLHEAEIVSVKANGIRLLSGDFLAARIRQREAAGDLPPAIAARLLGMHDAEAESRRGKVCFSFNKRMLDDEGGVGRFFKYWGGESLYRRHSLDGVTSPWIEKIGVPCIIEAAIRVGSIPSSFTDIPARMLSVYLLNRQVEPEKKADAEGYVLEAVAAGRVRRVIRLTDPDFVALTRCDHWDECPK